MQTLLGQNQRRISQTIAAIVFCAGFATPLAAQERPPVPPAPPAEGAFEPIPNDAQAGYSLDQLVQLAEENNPLLRRDLARIDSARGAAVQAGLYPNPRIDSTNPNQFNGSATQVSTGYLQTIVTGGKLGLDRAAALEVARQTQLAYQQDRYDLLHNVRQQFYTVLASQERTRVMAQTKVIVEQAEQTGQRLFQGGQGNYTDVLALQIETRRVDIALRNSLTLQATGKRQLAAYVGLPELDIIRVRGNLYGPPPPFESDSVREAILARNTQIQIGQVDVLRRQFVLRRAEAEVIPNIDAMLGWQYTATAPHDQFLFYLTFPLPLWNRNQGGIAAAAAGVQESIETVGVVQASLLQQAGEALGRFRSAAAQAEEYRLRILPKSRDALNLARSGYDQGVFDFNRFLTAQRTLVDGRLGHINALDAQWNAATDIGQLTQQDNFP